MSMISSLRKNRAARQYAAAIALTLLLSFSFYSWLLYAILKVPIVWVITIMTPATLFAMGAVTFGYRLWFARNAQVNEQPASEASLRPWVIALYTLVVGGLAWFAIYLIWRGLALASILTAIGTATIALYGLIRLEVFRQVLDVSMTRSKDGVGRSFLESFRAFTLGFCAIAIPVTFAVVFVIEREFKSAVVLFAISGAILPWAVRKIRAELWPKR